MGSPFESQFWASVDNGSDPALYEAYLAKYPNGTFADLARIKIMKLRSNAAPPQVFPPPAPPKAIDSVPPSGFPNGKSQEAVGNPPSGMLPQGDATALQTPGKAADTAVTARSDQTVPLPGYPAPRPAPSSSAEVPYVTKVVPAEAEADAGDSKLNGLLDAINPAARSQGNPGSAPPSAPLSDRPRGQVDSTPPSQPGAAYGTAPSDPAYQHPIAVGTLPADFALPPRPILVTVPPVNFPESFCSAEARNAFHNNVYRPAVEAATRNNDLTGVYLRELQAIYDRYNLSGTAEPQNAVAAESRAYKQISDQAFFTQSALVNAFKSLMAVPIIPCEAQR